jgi:Fe2+ transport system protein FeoA
MNLIDAKRNQLYTITKLLDCDKSIQSRFFQLGFMPGNELILKRKAPLFGDPLLFEIGDSQIALTKLEAALIEVDKVKIEIVDKVIKKAEA